MKRAAHAPTGPFILWLAGALLAFGAALAPAAAQDSVASAQRLGIPAMKGAIQPDAVLHAVGGIMAGMLAASAASTLSSPSTLTEYPLFLPAVGFSAALTAGIAKETLDSTGFGTAQWTDLFHTMIGGLLVAGMIAGVELSPTSGSFSTQRNVFALTGISLAVPIGAAFAEEIHLYLVRRSLQK